MSEMSGENMGPLKGIRVVEIAGIGPGPFAAMVLADLGADVLRIDRADRVREEIPPTPHFDWLNRGRRSAGVDLKHPDGVETVLTLVERADGLIEGFRPGVAERLGIGPDACLERNPRMVYGRMTGWGQDGPYASMAGHDINYIALSGVLGSIGRAGEAPVPPVNLAGDFGGGGMLLAVGMLAGMLEARASGRGQVVDASMVEGSALLITMMYAMHDLGAWGPRGTNLLDTGAWFYDVYECADGEYISLGSLEPQFFAEMVEKVGLDADGIDQNDRSTWPEMRARLTETVKSRTRDEWCEILGGSNACFAPVLGLSEAPEHPHNVARGTFVDVGGTLQPGPAPRFSRTPARIARPAPHPGQHTAEALVDWGLDTTAVADLQESGAVR